MNTIHLRCLFRMNPLVWCLRADVAAELRLLRRYSVLSIHFSEDEIYEQNQSLLFSPLSTFLIDSCHDICPAWDDGLHF
ncbi:hypothetical protein DNR33_25495 [Escherichia coli]|uniref:Uncharacterized protein n=5 Tax=Enterobacteriaceae TaxID=543 RepID=A0A2D0ERF5_ECOLX|nr:hypothetical protein CNQ56_15395 [Escherichia coli]OYE57871.1 hypothetical protein CI633_03350 [Shigella sonnei]OYK78200.1 hypothetical protein CI719_05255 [Shigella boydii]ATB88549.1 hypothetical protein CNQ53_15880 [Escherichia coli]AZZ25940.1 hypothetical protein CY655_07600 [Escherichia coli]